MSAAAGPAAGRRSIALVHYAASPVIGGVEQVIGAHARLMTADGHEVRIVAGRGSGEGTGAAVTTVPLIDPRNPRIEAVQAELRSGRVPAGFRPLVARLRRELAAALDGTDVVIAHNVASLSLNLALTAALRVLADAAAGTGRRVILWHHDLAAVAPDYRATLHPGYPWSLLREAWPGAVQVVVSEQRRRDLASVTGLAPEAIHVVPNGIDLARTWKLEPQAAPILERIERLGIEILLLVPARVTPRKNLELALAILAALRAAGRAAALVVTGPVDPHRASEHTYLDDLLARRAELGLDEVAWLLAAESAGDVSDAVMGDLYRLSDVMLLPSRDEGFGLPILEAAANRLPIACADLPVLRELAGEDGLYFGLDEPPASIASRLATRLGADPAWRLSRRVRTGYAWEPLYRTQIAPLLAAGSSSRAG